MPKTFVSDHSICNGMSLITSHMSNTYCIWTKTKKFPTIINRSDFWYTYIYIYIHIDRVTDFNKIETTVYDFLANNITFRTDF